MAGSRGMAEVASDDAKLLESLGYKQELKRSMGGFSNFAISFSVICILAGGITSVQLGTSALGGAAAGFAWPLGVIFALVVALGMAQIGSAYPTAGGLYHWSSTLGGKGWGWATAWFNLLGLIFVTAAVNVGTYQLAVSTFGGDPAKLGFAAQTLGVVVIAISHGILNHLGIRLTTLLIDFSGYLIFAVAAVLTVALLGLAPTHDFSRLFTFTNTSGDAGGGVWPGTGNVSMLFLLALLWPIYTITGFDASAHTAEETKDASRNVPKGIIRAVFFSGLFGWIMVSAIVLALPSVAEGAKQAGNIFFWMMDQVMPGWLKWPLEVGILVANYLCGLACLTSTSRMLYAFSRDGGMPGSQWLRRVSPTFGSPATAVWVAAALAVACTLYSPAYSTLTTATVIFLYISYVMPSAVGFFAYGKKWQRMGPFDLGGPLYKTICVLSVLGTAVLIYAGVQPPNQPALPVTFGLAVLLVVAWFGGMRKAFKGPPHLAAQNPAPAGVRSSDPVTKAV
ncbi:MAG TPA: amino acid permease [Chthoniobacterales bacterium]